MFDKEKKDAEILETDIDFIEEPPVCENPDEDIAYETIVDDTLYVEDDEATTAEVEKEIKETISAALNELPAIKESKVKQAIVKTISRSASKVAKGKLNGQKMNYILLFLGVASLIYPSILTFVKNFKSAGRGRR